MSPTKGSLPPQYTQSDFATPAEYEEYLALESDGFLPDLATEGQRKAAAQVATNTIKKIAGEKVPVGIHLPRRDVQRL